MSKKSPDLTLSAAMIVRDGGDMFPKTLASITPFIDDLIVVDTGSKDDSREVAKKAGARLFEMVWPDHFGKARQESWNHIKTAYALWIDADDVLLGGEHLRPAIADIDPDQRLLGIWSPYQYAFDEYGNVTTFHRRERIVRMSVGWKWERRIHEVLAPQRPGIWVKRDDIIWKHLRPPTPQMERNLRYLFMDYAEKPDDLRTIYYIGLQYFAGTEWAKAAEWLERFYANPNGLLVERWQAVCYAARAWRMLKDYNQALLLSMTAIELAPWWADGYLQMAEIYNCLEQWDKAIYWGEQARKVTQEVPEPAFVNPVEDAAEVACVLNRAYAMIGKYSDALRETEIGLRLMPRNAGLLSNNASFKDAIEKVLLRESFVRVTQGMGDAKVLSVARNMNGVAKEDCVRDIVIPAMMRKTKRGTQPEVSFFCGETLDEWTAETPNSVGIGGSETAVVEIAKRMAQDGFRVWVYNKCGVEEGMYDGVGYVNWQRWREDNKTDHFVAWRMAFQEHGKSQAKTKWLWMHDLNKGVQINEANTVWADKVLGVSEFHADYMAKAYPFLNGRLGYFRNGVDLARFDQQVERNPHKAIWVSSPDRGLIHLLDMWPIIRNQNANAELHIFYGWENIDKCIANGAGDLAAYKVMCLERMKQPGVIWGGRINQYELAKEFLTSQVWVYPTSFVETGCISAVEAMAAGCHIAASALGNIPNIVGDAGLLIPGHPGQESYRTRFVGLVLGAISGDEGLESLRARGPARAQSFTWDKAYESWKEALVAERTLVCV